MYVKVQPPFIFYILKLIVFIMYNKNYAVQAMMMHGGTLFETDPMDLSSHPPYYQNLIIVFPIFN